MASLRISLEWAYSDQSGPDGWGYFVTLLSHGIMRACNPNDVIGISLKESTPYRSAYLEKISDVGYMGAVEVRDDGTCTSGTKCTVAPTGVATKGDRWYVLNRLDKNTITILFK